MTPEFSNSAILTESLGSDRSGLNPHWYRDFGIFEGENGFTLNGSNKVGQQAKNGSNSSSIKK
ncbi:MAG: hypothetical protein F6K39_17380 [Okeania sp. SIO3B3]|nr:hypothetical protein [Okeania sp. SIO3B3]